MGAGVRDWSRCQADSTWCHRVVVVPIEAASVVGTLAGLGEITKTVFGEGGTGTAAARQLQSARRGSVPASGGPGAGGPA